MLAIRFYALVWFIVTAAAAVVYISGYFNPVTHVVFGFILSTLFFAGIVGVLPVWVSEQHSPKY